VNELPKSVRDEMARQQLSAGAHPDADLLTAFAEGTATPAERVRVEQHLALCSECREVMFLAAAPIEPTAPVVVVAPKTRQSWFRTWAPWATAAVVLVVATFTLTHKDNSSPQLSMAKESAPSPAPQPPSASISTSPSLKGEIKSPAAARSTNGQLASAPALDAAKQKDDKVQVARRDKEEIAKNELKKSMDSLAGAAIVAGSPSAVPPRSPQAAPTETYASNRAARNTTLKPGPAAPMQNQATQNQQNQSLQDLRASKSSETVEVTADAAPVMEANTKAEQTAGAASLTAFRRSRNQWRISSDGNVERSTGVNWSTSLAQPGTKFTVVATIGPIVWAGGTRGVLMRSVDNGASWQPIQLPNIGTGANATITKIEFRDAFTGTIATADRRSWSTKDRGESWQQP
jgi:hypothetical protein